MRVKIDQDYARLRAGAYASTGEQLGAAAKIMKAVITGEPVPDDALAVLEQIDAVKAKYPKRG